MLIELYVAMRQLRVLTLHNFGACVATGLYTCTLAVVQLQGLREERWQGV